MAATTLSDDCAAQGPLTQLMYVILLIVALYQVYELAAFRAANLYGGR